jgi:hypothetical protein
MKPHPYLRAFMAGIVLPTWFLLGAMTIFAVARFVYDVPVPIERAIAFPMALVPNAWGLWNVLYLALGRRPWSIGVHGALLPLLLLPAGYTLARLLDITFVTVAVVAIAAPVAIALYYLAWKYLVSYFNRVVGL